MANPPTFLCAHFRDNEAARKNDFPMRFRKLQKLHQIFYVNVYLCVFVCGCASMAAAGIAVAVQQPQGNMHGKQKTTSVPELYQWAWQPAVALTGYINISGHIFSVPRAARALLSNRTLVRFKSIHYPHNALKIKAEKQLKLDFLHMFRLTLLISVDDNQPH